MSVTVLPRFVEPEEAIVTRPYAFLATLQVLDVLTTWFALRFWSQRAEGNPVAAIVLHHAGLTLGLLCLLAVKLGVVWLFYRCQTRVRLASAIYGLVIVNNVIFLSLGLALNLGGNA